MGGSQRKLILPPIPTNYTRDFTDLFWITGSHYKIPARLYQWPASVPYVINCSATQNPRAHWTVIYSSTNYEDLGSVSPKMVMLCELLKVDIVSFDYCGWGLNQTRDPSESSLNECLEQVFKWVVSVKKVPLDRIIL
jgi:hypothetical protein